MKKLNCELCRSELCELCKTELRRYWEGKYRKGSSDSKPIKKFKRIDGKDCYMLEEPTDSLIETLNATDKNCFPNIYKVLEIPCISPLASTEAERAASGIKRLIIEAP